MSATQSSDALKQARVEWYLLMFAKFETTLSGRDYDIITGLESRIYQYNPKTNGQSTVWLFQNEPTPTNCKQLRSA